MQVTAFILTLRKSEGEGSQPAMKINLLPALVFSRSSFIACPEHFDYTQRKRSRRVSRSSLVVLTFLFSLFSILFSLSSASAFAGACDAPIQPNDPTSAQQAIDTLNKCAIEKNVFDDKIFNTNQIAGTVDSLYTLMFGTSQLHPETNVATRGGGTLATSSRLVATLYGAPPVSGVEYFAQKIHQFNPVQPAYAETGGIGFNALQPVQRIWTIFRNISYVGFVIVFVIMGFMIMFRTHISPQAVATVQDSIPRIVIALILVTFSYAIAGLMIDVMFLFLNVTINALQAGGLITADKTNYIFENSIFGVITGSWTDIFARVATNVSHAIDGIIDLGALDWAAKLFGLLGGGLAALVVGIALLFIMFRIFFMLLMAYVMIIILTMAAPFFFLIQALPGRNGAGEWFKQMASQIAVFPTVALMVIFAGILAGINKIVGDTGVQAIQQGNVGQFPLLTSGLSTEAVSGLIGIGILLMTPSAAELVRNALGVKGGPNVGAGLGAGLAGGMAVAGAAGRGAWDRAYNKGPLGAMSRTGAAMRQEREQVEAKQKIFDKIQTNPRLKKMYEDRGIGYK